MNRPNVAQMSLVDKGPNIDSHYNGVNILKQKILGN